MSQYFYSPIGDEIISHTPFTYSGHNVCAVDINVARGTPIYAMATGVVSYCTDGAEEGDPNINGGAGNYIQLQIPSSNWGNGTTGQTLYIRYLHLQKDGVKVEINQTVHKGELIGYSGNTGDSTGPHLHIDLSTDSSWGNVKIVINENNCSKFNELSQLSSIKTLEKQQGTSNALNNYTYYIFGQKPIKITTNISGGETLTKTGRVPDAYYTTIFSKEQVTAGTNYIYNEMIDYASGLCYREMGESTAGADYTINGISIYAKLIRARWIESGKTLKWVFENSGFSGFNWQKLSQLNVNSNLQESIKGAVEANLCQPGAFKILSQYLDIVNGAPYFNYGYSGEGYPINTPDIEEELTNKILNKTIISHLTLGNSKKLLGCVGNTALFANNNWL